MQSSMCSIKTFRPYLWVFISCIFQPYQNVQGLLVRKYGFNEYSLPTASWTVYETKEMIKTVTECVEIAQQAKKYALIYEKNNHVCHVGSVDLEITDGTGGYTNIFIRDVPKVGMSHGNSLGDGDFEIVLPNGKICPPSDHGLPTFDAANPLSYHSITEVDGIIYMCGGEFTELDESLACFKYNLNINTPSWETMTPMSRQANKWPNYGRMLFQGLIPYKDSKGDLILFAVYINMCKRNNAQAEKEHIYMFKDNTWIKAGHIAFRWGAVARDGHIIYLAGGDTCIDPELPNPRSKKIWAFDMSSPMEDARPLGHELMHGVTFPGCAVLEVGSNRGLVCAGGKNSANDRVKHVQFIPLSGTDSAGPCELLTPLPMVKFPVVMLKLDTAEAILYGNDNNKTNLIWNAEKSIFEVGHESTKDLSRTAYGTINSRWILFKCWKYL